MRLFRLTLPMLVTLLATAQVLAQDTTNVQRETVGNRVTENIPEIPADLRAGRRSLAKGESATAIGAERTCPIEISGIAQYRPAILVSTHTACRWGRTPTVSAGHLIGEA